MARQTKQYPLTANFRYRKRPGPNRTAATLDHPKRRRLPRTRKKARSRYGHEKDLVVEVGHLRKVWYSVSASGLSGGIIQSTGVDIQSTPDLQASGRNDNAGVLEGRGTAAPKKLRIGSVRKKPNPAGATTTSTGTLGHHARQDLVRSTASSVHTKKIRRQCRGMQARDIGTTNLGERLRRRVGGLHVLPGR
ncbi:hypothetical protein B0H13DRAFT_1922007 [Mycena leptocephala]|nr:hypothetical protein B0H13DRAFT_1922007 [Mycena leptocephala]